MKKKSKITIGHVFKTIIWPRRKIVFVGLVLIVISRLAGLVLPGATKYLMDDVIADKNLIMLKYLLIAVVAAVTVQAATSYLLTKNSQRRGATSDLHFAGAGPEKNTAVARSLF